MSLTSCGPPPARRSIFGVWPGAGFVGRTGREQVAAAYAVHGPRTVLVLARPRAGGAGAGLVVQEFALQPGGGWALARDDIRVPPAKAAFAPANLRAAADNAAYAALVQRWMGERYTLRYSGGMVPDVHHILAKVRRGSVRAARRLTRSRRHPYACY